MNAKLAPVPQTDPDPRSELTTALKAAQRREAAAVESLASADRDLERKQALVRSCAHDAEQLSTAIATNDDFAAAEHLANQHRTAEVRLTTSRNMLAKSKTARDLAHGEVQNAQRAVNQAAQHIFDLEVRAELERNLQLFDEYYASCAKLVAASRGVGRGALTPVQWFALYRRGAFTAEQLGMTSPEMNVSLPDLQKIGQLGPAEDQLRKFRDRVRQGEVEWNAQFDATSRGDAVASSDTSTP